MISTGEESGQLDTMLNTVAGNYEEELALIADRMTGLAFTNNVDCYGRCCWLYSSSNRLANDQYDTRYW